MDNRVRLVIGAPRAESVGELTGTEKLTWGEICEDINNVSIGQSCSSSMGSRNLSAAFRGSPEPSMEFIPDVFIAPKA